MTLHITNSMIAKVGRMQPAVNVDALNRPPHGWLAWDRGQ